jgi:hypothetical protein
MNLSTNLDREKLLFIASMSTAELNKMLDHGLKNATQGTNMQWAAAIMNELDFRERTRG